MTARVRPNPSIERTRNGMPRMASISFWAMRVLPLRAAHVKRYTARMAYRSGKSMSPSDRGCVKTPGDCEAPSSTVNLTSVRWMLLDFRPRKSEITHLRKLRREFSHSLDPNRTFARYRLPCCKWPERTFSIGPHLFGRR